MEYINDVPLEEELAQVRQDRDILQQEVSRLRVCTTTVNY